MLSSFCSPPVFSFIISHFLFCKDSEQALSELDEPVNQRIIFDRLNELNCDTYAVRSSANFEDSAFANFAGIFESILFVKKDNLIDAIRKVLISTESVISGSYCVKKGIDILSMRMNVIIQRQLKSRVSGVCYTKLNGYENNIIIEGCEGSCDKLVSGEITPVLYTLDRQSAFKLVESDYSSIESDVIEKNCRENLFSKTTYPNRLLSPNELIEICKIALQIESLLNLSYNGVDVEWSYEGNNLFILQARPVI